MHPSFGVPGDTHVVADVLVPYLVDPELRAVVEDAHRLRGLHRLVVAVPEELRLRCALRLAVEDDGVPDVDVRDIIRGGGEARGSCGW